MRILIIGEQHHLKEFELKFGVSHHYTLLNDHVDAEDYLDQNELIFDFIIDEEPDQFDIYIDKKVIVFFNTCKVSLSELAYTAFNDVACTMFGFNGLPTFVNRNIFEVTVRLKED